MDTRAEIAGEVRSAELAAPLEGVELIWTDHQGISIQKTKTDSRGRWHLGDRPSSGTITFQKAGFVPKTYPAGKLPETARLLEDQLLGYHDKIWFHPGEEVSARVHAPRSFSARLFRHGTEKEESLDAGSFPGQLQSVPDRHFTEMGVEWEANVHYRIPPEARPGLYSLLLEADDYYPFAIPMVVSTPPSQYGNGKLLVLASTNNWQTYNIWGGRNRYRNFEDRASGDFLRQPGKWTELLARAGKIVPRPLVRIAKRAIGMEQNDPPWKFKKLSIRRPFTNCSLEEDDPRRPFTNHLAAGEWRVLAWLEQEGIEYDIVSGIELHRNPDLLQHYHAVILSTHSEYWSRAMYEGLKKFHLTNGLSIVNLSGNSIYREANFFEDGSIRCVSLKFGESVEDETQLLGVRFTEGDYGTCAPYRVEEPDHWVFEDLNLSEHDSFGERSLNRMTPAASPRYDPGRPGTKTGLKGSGASGWETDKLSRTAPGGFTFVAKGMNRFGGADMVVRNPEGTRGGVFSASSVTFGGALLIDDGCSGMVKNVLNRWI